MYQLSILIQIVITFILPILVAILLIRRERRLLRPLLIGAATFTISQVCIRIPLMQGVLVNTSWYIKMSIANPISSFLFLSSTAALFEEVGRYIAMRLFLKDQLKVKDGIAFGVGHGGIESILLVGINSIVLLFIYIDADSSMFIASSIERIAAIGLHIICSVIVMQGVAKAKVTNLFLAILIHTAFNFSALYMLHIGLNIWIVEFILLFVSIFGLLYVWSLFKKEQLWKNY